MYQQQNADNPPGGGQAARPPPSLTEVPSQEYQALCEAIPAARRPPPSPTEVPASAYEALRVAVPSDVATNAAFIQARTPVPSVANSSPMQASPAMATPNLPGDPPGIAEHIPTNTFVEQGTNAPNLSQVYTDVTMQIGVLNEDNTLLPASDQVRNFDVFQPIEENVLFNSVRAPVPEPVLQTQGERAEFFRLASDRERKRMEESRSQSIDLLTGSDRLQAFVHTKNLEDAEGNMFYAQENMLVGAEGYSNFFLGEDTPLRVVEEGDIILGPSIIRGMAQIVGAAISAGPCNDDAWRNGEVLAGLDNSSWFRLTMSVLASIARGCGRVPNVHARGNFPIDYEADNFTYSNDLEAPTSQADIVRKLAAQIYSAMGGPGEDDDPALRAINIRAAQWERFEWAIRSETAAQAASISRYVDSTSLLNIMTQVMMERPLEEITDTMREGWEQSKRSFHNNEMLAHQSAAYQRAKAEAIAKGEQAGHSDGEEENKERLKRLIELENDLDNQLKAEIDQRQKEYEENRKTEWAKLDRLNQDLISEYKDKLQLQYTHMSEAARQDFVRKAAWELNLIPEEEAFPARKGKKAKVEPKSHTAMLAAEKGKLIGKVRSRSRSSSVCSVRKRDRSTSPPARQSPSITSIPSTVHPAMEDDTTPTGSPTVTRPTLQEGLEALEADYGSMRSLSSSIHAPGNQMETDAHIPPPEPAAINPVDNFGQLVNGVCDLINPRFERIEHAISNVDEQFKRLHETLAKLAQPPQQQQQPLPPPVPKGGTFSWDDVVEDLIMNNPEGVPINKLVNEGHNPFSPEQLAQQEREEDVRMERLRKEGEAYMKEHRLDQEEFPPMPSTSQATQVVAPKNRKGKQRAKIAELNARIPGAAPVAPAREATPVRAQEETIATSTAPEHTRGHIEVKQTKLKPMFATVTAAAIGQHETQGAFLKVQKRTQKGPQVQLRPGASSTTEVTIIRHGGVKGDEEARIRARSAANIVAEVQNTLQKKTAHPPRIVSGRWSSRVDITGNFVYLIQGVLSCKEVLGLSTTLCGPFPGDCYAVPSDGWMWAHIRGVPTSLEEGAVLNNEDLAKELFSNSALQGLFIPGMPSWLQHPRFVATQSKATVMFAYVDKDGETTKKLAKEAIYMFGSQVQFVPVGNKPIQQQCSKCWALGHKFGECKLGEGEVKCFVCGGKHHGSTHDFECAGKHKTPGVCDCKFKCMLCGDHKHNAASINCPKKINVLVTKKQWLRIEKEKRGNREEERTQLAPQNPQVRRHKKTQEREWTPAQRDMMEQALKVTAEPCANDNSRTKGGCACCPPPAIDYEDAIVRCYARPTPDELSRILTHFPLAATRIIDNLRNSGRLGSDDNHPEGPSYPEGSLARRPKVKPRIVRPKQRVDWNDEDDEVEDILEDEEDIPGPSNVDIADILPPSIYEVQRVDEPHTYTPPAMEPSVTSGWDQNRQETSPAAPNPNA